ncbi:hypothetical protein LJC08_00475 [Methanimicrococcus sp. OttesenSCG-928-J09]|nr:hypothetical protein [Methanimicrococcus sp. OttesenSCG-928-J09]
MSSLAWFADNLGLVFWILFVLFIAYYFYTKKPLEKPVKQMIKTYGRETFLEKNVIEIESFLDENVDFSEVDYVASDLAKAIYCFVNNINPKKYEKEQEE